MIESLVIAGILLAGGITTDTPELKQLPKVATVATDAGMKGVRPSTYRGKWFRSRFEATRMCIVRRESSGIYSAVSMTGKYRGAYQVSPELRVGMGWMIQKDLRQGGTSPGAARIIGLTLRATNANHWSRFWQDYGFWLVYRDGKGSHHWTAGQAYAC